LAKDNDDGIHKNLEKAKARRPLSGCREKRVSYKLEIYAVKSSPPT